VGLARPEFRARLPLPAPAVVAPLELFPGFRWQTAPAFPLISEAPLTFLWESLPALVIPLNDSPFLIRKALPSPVFPLQFFSLLGRERLPLFLALA
jgi:hypothetical protein